MVVWLSTTGAPGHESRGRLVGLFPHAVGARLNPGGVAGDASLDGGCVDPGAETLAPILLLLLDHMVEGAFQVALNQADSGAEPYEPRIWTVGFNRTTGGAQ